MESIKELLPDTAKDIRLNWSGIQKSDHLSEQQLWGTLLVSAIAARDEFVLAAIASEARTHLSEAAFAAAQSAASIMAMNNIYYRFLHLASNKEYNQMPARLRMQVIANPGVEKLDFELWCLTVSAINGCGMCIDSHEKVLRQAGALSSQIHDAVRIASVVHAAARALEAQRVVSAAVA